MKLWSAWGVGLATVSAVVPAGASPLADEHTCDPAADPVRITAHLTNVLAVLEARDTSDLDPAQREARRAGLAALRAYAEDGVYPRNVDFPGRLVAHFIDDDGRDCAVGRILIASGGAELAERVRDEQNNAQLAEMRVAGLAEWIASSGFSFDELAWIQPQYCGPDTYFPCGAWRCHGHPPEDPCSCEEYVDDDGTACGVSPLDVCDERFECLQGECIEVSPTISCPDVDDDVCTVDYCDPAAEACAVERLDCDDTNVCTVEECDPVEGCVYQERCDDGDPCTIDSCITELEGRQVVFRGCKYEDRSHCSDDDERAAAERDREDAAAAERVRSGGCATSSGARSGGALVLLGLGLAIWARRRTRA